MSGRERNESEKDLTEKNMPNSHEKREERKLLKEAVQREREEAV